MNQSRGFNETLRMNHTNNHSRFWLFYMNDSRKVGIGGSNMDLSVLLKVIGGDVEFLVIVAQGTFSTSSSQEADGVHGKIQFWGSSNKHGTNALHVTVPFEHIGDTLTILNI